MESPAPTLSYEYAKATIARPKHMIGNIEWENASNHSLFQRASFLLHDESGATIPGLTVELQFRNGLIQSECNYKFSIYSSPPKKRRIYQLEIYPADKLSHTENGERWFGSHHHFGEQAEKLANDPFLDCVDHEKWFYRFLELANISFSGKYFSPTEPDGQAELML